MSVSYLVAYLIGWGELVIKWHKLKINGMDVDFPETNFKWNQLGLLANKFYQDYQHLSYKELLLKLDEVYIEIVEIIKGLTNEQLYDIAWYKQWTQGKMIQLNTASPYKNARLRIRKSKKAR